MTVISGLFSFLATVFAFAETSPTDIAALTPQQLLARMSHASRHVSYQGTFTYQQRNMLATFKVIHTVHDDEEYEQLIRMDGQRREVVRSGNSLHCTRIGETLLANSDVSASISRYYDLAITGEDRVANRQVIELQLVPKDGMRHGYILSIDKQSGLLLRTLIISDYRNSPAGSYARNDGRNIGGKLLERFQFVNITIDPELATQLHSSNSATLIAGTELLPCDGSKEIQPGHWQVAALPKGFALAGLQQGERGEESLVFSDGMAFFSVFIEPVSVVMADCYGRRGASVVVMTHTIDQQQQYSICVVGEIPLSAARRVANSVGVAGELQE